MDFDGDKTNGSWVSENCHNYTKNGSISGCWSSNTSQFNKGKPTNSHYDNNHNGGRPCGINNKLALNRMLVGSIPNLNYGSRGIPLGKSLNWSLGILIPTTRFISRLHMVYANPIMMIHMTRFVIQPPPIPIVVIGHKNPRNGNQGRDFQCHLQEL